MEILGLITCAVFALLAVCVGYLYLLALAAIRAPTPPACAPRRRFAVVIPANDEEGAIGTTVARLRQQRYPAELFTIGVLADNCVDRTAAAARAAGAHVTERHDPGNRSKGHALAWFLPQVLGWSPAVDAIVVFDADSNVDLDFLRTMNAMLETGCRVVQGKHVVANPDDGWLPAFMYASFVLDNRLRNLGRSNLGWSSKLMGDGMCVARQVLEAHPWQATSETEDAEYWATLVLNGERIAFAPAAVSYGAIVTAAAPAWRQRARWMRGRAAVRRRFAVALVGAGLRRGQWRYVDAGIDLVMPAVPTLGLLASFVTAAALILPVASVAWRALLGLWVAVCVYPVLGLWLEGAPWRVYLSLAGAPAYLVWRAALGARVWSQRGPAPWARTPRSVGDEKSSGVDTHGGKG